MNDNASDYLIILTVFVLFGLWAWSVTWSMEDADRRGKPGCLVGAFVGVVSWPLSLIL